MAAESGAAPAGAAGATASGIAVIGAAGRFPGAPTVERFWRNLCDGVESVSFFTGDELAAAGVAAEIAADPLYVPARGVLQDVELFDAAFFGLTPREAEVMDPQHRIFLECAWEALEAGGCDPFRYAGAIGLFAGSGTSHYLLRNLAPHAHAAGPLGDLEVGIGNERDALTTLTAYKLNLTGPCFTVQTFCSTSLVAVHLACSSLLAYECDMALAGGVAIEVPQTAGYRYLAGGFASPDGRCRAFDAEARGTPFGNGAGVVLLKRLSEALADGDPVMAVIRGSAVNNDGALKASYGAPSLGGQTRVIAEALENAGAEPETVGYVEAHGTGTPLGDSVEVAALGRAFRARTGRTGFCALGSVKTNIGHLDRASGIAGLIKAVMAVRHGVIPPSLHCRHPNPELDLPRSPFFVNTALRPWPLEGPRRAGVSSFGMGGTNAHVVLEEAPAAEPPPPPSTSRPWQLLVLSARTGTALSRATAELAEHLLRHPEASLPDVAFTLQAGRAEMAHRRALVCRETAEAAAALAAADPARLLEQAVEELGRPVIFLFPGLGDHYVGMGRELYAGEPVFRTEVDRCAEALAPELGLDLRQVLYPAGTVARDAGGAAAADGGALRRRLRPPAAQLQRDGLARTRLAQPAMFVVSYALARLWMSWGVRPRALLGTSVGEYVAACLAGVLPLADALRLVARRAALIEELPPGAMLAVPGGPREVELLLGADLADLTDLEVAIEAAPDLCVVGGPEAAVTELEERLRERGGVSRRVTSDHAFHTRMMRPAVAPLTRLAAEAERMPPQMPYLSNVTGDWITEAEAIDPEYWGRHMAGPVRLDRALATLWREPDCILLEVGPGQALGSVALQHAGAEAPGRNRLVLGSLRGPHGGLGDAEQMLQSLGRLWLAGTAVDWAGLHAGERRRRVPLPTYPFDRRRYWVEPPAGGGPAATVGGSAASPASPAIPAPPATTAPRGPGTPPASAVGVGIAAEAGITAGQGIAAGRGIAAGERIAADEGPGPEREPDLERWFFAPTWKQSPLPLAARAWDAAPPSPAARQAAASVDPAAHEAAASLDSAPPAAPSTLDDGPWLLFLDGCGVGERLAARLRRAGQVVFTVTPGPALVDAGARWSLDPGRAEHYGALLDGLGGGGRPLPRRIVHLWGVTGGSEASMASDGLGEQPEGRFEESQSRGFHSLLFLAQALALRGPASAPSIVVVTDPLDSVTGAEPLRPEAATVLGPCRVIPLEYPGWSCRLIQLLFAASEAEAVAELLLLELAVGREEMVAHRHGMRWVPACEPVATAGAVAAGAWLRERGVYLVTGGLGGIGLVVAGVLARAVRARLVLVGRRPVPPRGKGPGSSTGSSPESSPGSPPASSAGSPPGSSAGSPPGSSTGSSPGSSPGSAAGSRLGSATSSPTGFPLSAAETEGGLERRLAALEELGAELLLLDADVTDAAQMRRVIEATVERFGALHGVFHLAGVIDDAPMQSKTAASAAAVMAPKVRGTLVLDELLRGRGTDFLILFSSMAAETGNVGQVDHCAANAFLDSFAQQRSRRGDGATTALAWDAWRGVGAAARAAARLPPGSPLTALLDGGIEPEEGAEALRRVLAVRPLPRLLISARVPASLAAGVRDAARRLLAHARGRRGSGARSPRSLSGVPYTPPRDAAEEAVAAIWRDVLRVEPVGAHDGFVALGGHSLLAIQVLSRLRASLGVEVPLRAFFAARTLAELARTVEGLIVAQVAAMSEEEAERAAGPPAPDAAATADAGAADAGAEPVRVTLPNGMSILTFSRAEADHFYRDIFEHHGYLRHGVQLGDGACVLDVGANVGLFTLYVHARCRGATVYAFEPAPPAFELLRANTEALGAGVKRFPCGVAEARRQATLTFYPRSSGMSSFHADREQEGAVLRVLIHNARSSGAPGAIDAASAPEMAELVAHAEELIEERLAARSFLCPLVPLSEIIREHAIPRIDLLKVDVQKSELAVLRGVATEDWPKIRQVAMEVHDLDGELARARRLLAGLGYSVHVEQDDLYRGSLLYNLYAVRP